MTTPPPPLGDKKSQASLNGRNRSRVRTDVGKKTKTRRPINSSTRTTSGKQEATTLPRPFGRGAADGKTRTKTVNAQPTLNHDPPLPNSSLSTFPTGCDLLNREKGAGSAMMMTDPGCPVLPRRCPPRVLRRYHRQRGRCRPQA
ncbi:unnamed protein product [Ectocarpus fasciculatus]